VLHNFGEELHDSHINNFNTNYFKNRFFIFSHHRDKNCLSPSNFRLYMNCTAYLNHKIQTYKRDFEKNKKANSA